MRRRGKAPIRAKLIRVASGDKSPSSDEESLPDERIFFFRSSLFLQLCQKYQFPLNFMMKEMKRKENVIFLTVLLVGVRGAETFRVGVASHDDDAGGRAVHAGGVRLADVPGLRHWYLGLNQLLHPGAEGHEDAVDHVEEEEEHGLVPVDHLVGDGAEEKDDRDEVAAAVAHHGPPIQNEHLYGRCENVRKILM